MQRLSNPRRLVALAFALLYAGAPLLAAPLSAQTPGSSSAAATQFRVIVQDLVNKTDPKSTRWGVKASEQIRSGISKMSTHTAVPAKDVTAELKKLGVSPPVDCTTLRQLQSRVGAEVVMCGDYTEEGGATKVTASFYTLAEAISYDIQPVTATSEQDAADKVVAQFQTYVHQLQLAKICETLVASEQWDQALDQCTKALQLNPRSTTSNYFRATAFLKLGQPDSALAGYQRVLEISPVNSEAMRSAGTVAAQLGKSDLSAKYYHDYLELNPGDEQVRLTMANDLNKAGDPVAAAKMLEDGLKGDTTNLPMIGAIGNYYMVAAANDAKGVDTAKAKSEFASALKNYEIIQRNIEKAKLDKISLDNLYRYMMQAYQGVGQTDKVFAIGAIAATNDSVTGPTLTVYAAELAKAGRLPEAIAVLNKAKAKDPTMKIAYSLASMSMVSGNLDDAVKYAQQAQAEGATDEQIDGIAQTLLAGSQDPKRSSAERAAWMAAGKQLAKSDKSKAMIDFYEGSALYQQGTSLIPSQKSGKVISKADARTAIGLLQRARALIAGSTAFTEAASSRASFISGIDQTVNYLNQVIKAGQ